MQSDTSKRRMPRFSLITLLVAVNVTGVLVWANVRGHGGGYEWFQGWPFAWWHSTDMVQMDVPEWEQFFQVHGLIGNVIMGIGIVLVVAVSTEFLVRKFRQAKRHDG